MADTMDELIAENARLREALATVDEELAGAMKIIRDHVPIDALGIDSDGGDDGWNTRSWPVLDEALHYMYEARGGANCALLALSHPANGLTQEG